MGEPSLLEDLREFVALHRAHGELHAKAGESTPNGYRLKVACPCGVVFERWVASGDAAIDLVLFARWNWDNRCQFTRRR
jgi:hypothetical protein